MAFLIDPPGGSGFKPLFLNIPVVETVVLFLGAILVVSGVGAFFVMCEMWRGEIR